MKKPIVFDYTTSKTNAITFIYQLTLAFTSTNYVTIVNNYLFAIYAIIKILTTVASVIAFTYTETFRAKLKLR